MRTLLVLALVLGGAFWLGCEPEPGSDGDAAATACTTDSTCDAERFCDFSDGTCQPGCRNNASCAAGEVCDGARVCVPEDQPLGGPGDTCDDDSGCDAPLVCGTLTGTCIEP